MADCAISSLLNLCILLFSSFPVFGNNAVQSSENLPAQWISIPELTEMIQKYPDKFYPLHISALRKYLNIK